MPLCRRSRRTDAESDDDVAKPLGSLADQRLQGIAEVACRNAFEIQPGNQLFDRLTLAQIRRQHARRERHPVIFVRRSIPHARLNDLQRPGPGQDFSGGKLTIANHLASPLLITAIGMLGEEALHLGIDGLLQHASGSLADDLIQRTAGLEVRSKLQHLRLQRLAGGLCVADWCCVIGCRSLAHGVSLCPRRAAGEVKSLSRIRRLSSTHENTTFDNISVCRRQESRRGAHRRDRAPGLYRRRDTRRRNGHRHTGSRHLRGNVPVHRPD